MDEKHYELRILPLFEEKLQEAVDSIICRLRSPAAAEAFLNTIEAAIYDRLHAPEAVTPCRAKKDREDVYYAIPVKNLLVFYAVIGNVMEVRTLAYARRKLKKLV